MIGLRKIWHIYTMDYYSAVMKNEIISLEGKWMELEIIMLNEARFIMRKVTFFLSYGR
jgi:hypothetical protein